MDETIQQQPEYNEPVLEDAPQPEPEPQTEVDVEPEISISDGEVKFRDDFFGDVQDEPIADEAPEPPAPNYYTDDELQNTPYEQWDMSRMPEEVQRYAKYLNAQTAARQAREQIEQRANTTPSFLNEPKQFTPKELNQEAEKLAVQRLGLEDVDELDEYEGEHRAAIDMARQELMQKRNSEISSYQRTVSEYQQLQRFNAELSARPDFGDFQTWYMGKLKESGHTLEQVNGGLGKVAQTQGFKAVQDFWGYAFREFLGERAKSTQSRTPRAKTPPTLERSRGGSYDNRKSFNVREFGQLDDDAQAQALMDMGIKLKGEIYNG